MTGGVPATVSHPRPTTDPDPLVAIYDRYHDPVWRCLRALGVPYDALDDATQDVFMVVHRRLPDFDHAAPVGAWVLGIARNVARKYRSARPSRPLLQVIHRESPASPEQIVEQRRAAAVVQSFLDGLPPEQREVFVMMEVHGLSAPQTAAQTGASLNTVYSRLRLARKRFDRTVAAAVSRQGRST